MSGRPYGPLPPEVPPARRDLAAFLRAAVAEAGLPPYRKLGAMTQVSPATISRVLKGDVVPNLEVVESLCEALGLGTQERLRAHRLWLKAREERQADLRGSELFVDLAGLRHAMDRLRTTVGMSLRQLADRMAAMGQPISKTHLDRIFKEPEHAPEKALQVAEFLITQLPRSERQDASDLLVALHTVAERKRVDAARRAADSAPGSAGPYGRAVWATEVRQAVQELLSATEVLGQRLQHRLGEDDVADLLEEVREAGRRTRLLLQGPVGPAGDTGADAVLPDRTVAQVNYAAAEPALPRRGPGLPPLPRRTPQTTRAGSVDAPGGMDAYTAGLLQRIRTTETDLERARQEGDDFLIEVEEAELADLRRLAKEHGVEEARRSGQAR
jgi:transcriptional regulator with XRE-family HTH domain